MIVPHTWAALALSLAAAGDGPAPAPAPADVAALLAQVDAAWAGRDAPARLEEARVALERAAALAPDDYEVLWRQARFDVWLSDDLLRSREERSRIGRRGWETAERAIARDPSRVEGHLFAALGMGNYALSLGVLRALREGIEGKFKARLSRAEAIDPTYLSGTAYVAWGRFYYELPWPKYDARKSERRLREAIRVNPASARARVYLAELYLKEHRTDEARTELEEALAGEPGSYDAPEERRMQARAREILSNLH
jgi:tetratricopeptide (TPR) repeat protein